MAVVTSAAEKLFIQNLYLKVLHFGTFDFEQNFVQDKFLGG